jgi:hypothetical protein
MQLAQGLKRHGFRKWYERELLQSHAHLALAFLSCFGLFAAMEAAIHFTSWTDRVIDAAAILICAAVGLWSLRRYLYLLHHAEHVAHQADCPGCGAYGRLELVAAPLEDGPTSVRCRRCGRPWEIHA